MENNVQKGKRQKEKGAKAEEEVRIQKKGNENGQKEEKSDD